MVSCEVDLIGLLPFKKQPMLPEFMLLLTKLYTLHVQLEEGGRRPIDTTTNASQVGTSPQATLCPWARHRCQRIKAAQTTPKMRAAIHPLV